MNNFIDTKNNKIIDFDISDLPMLIHGRDKTGSSLFSITLACHLHTQGNKLLIFTAYPMAKEEFIKQVGSESVFYVENIKDISKVIDDRTIIIKSGDRQLCAQVLSELPDKDERILFIKNVDIMLNDEIIKKIDLRQKIFLSGDVDLSQHQDFIKNISYNTKVYFSESDSIPEDLLPLEKYQACVIKDKDKFVVSLN